MNDIIETLREFNYVTICIRLVLAIIAGGIIGNERGKHGSAAGLRTHILVCVGAAMTALTGYYVYDTLNISGDIMRLAAQVVSGIGFLGAGMIIVKNGNVVTGLTTAAGMWATAAIGIALGYGFYSGAIIATVACVFTAAFLSRLERKRKSTAHIYIEVDLSQNINDITSTIYNEIDSEALIEPVPPKSNMPNTIGLYVTVSNPKSVDEVKAQIDKISGVRFSLVE
ncbi:MAG: MgtC/SapB family protein [Clostridia bacterium]|nr:MgtC/SapB family protein [Clostridia bacterium]